MGLLTGGAKAGKKVARLIKNSDAVKTLSDAYYGGKNANNPHARFVDLSKGDDYALIEDYPIDSLAKHWDDRPKGIVDSTTRQAHVDEIKNMGNLPPIKLARNGHLSDGGHRVAAAVQRGETTIPALIRKPDAEKLGYEVGEAKNLLDMATDARMKRAAEQGYDTSQVYYHGTTAGGLDKLSKSGFDPEHINTGGALMGNGAYLTPSKSYASRYGSRFHEYNKNTIPEIGSMVGRDKKLVVPVYIKKGAVVDERFNGKEILVTDPSNIRSTNAAFDPAKRNSANLLAGAAGTAGVGLLGMGSNEAEAGIAGKLARLGFYANNAADGTVKLYRKTGEHVGDYEYVDDAMNAALSDSGKAVESGSIVDALMRRSGDPDLPDTSFRGGHTAPVDPEYNAPLHELNKIYPDDIYSPQAARYYGHGDAALDNETMGILQRLRGKPEEEIDVFRAVPSDAPDEMLPGDWVTPNENYARQHGEGLEQYKILKGKTKAKRLRTDGNSPHEFGYTGAIAAAPIAGLLGAGASNKGYAAPPTANDIFAQYGNEQQIQPAKHPKLAQAAGLLQGVETPLDGLLGQGWATEGVTGLLDKLSYGDKRKYSDYVSAAMDFF